MCGILVQKGARGGSFDSNHVFVVCVCVSVCVLWSNLHSGMSCEQVSIKISSFPLITPRANVVSTEINLALTMEITLAGFCSLYPEQTPLRPVAEPEFL